MPKKRKKKAKKTRRHLKVSLERIARHIGKIADNTSFKDIEEIILNAALAYAGYEVTKDWRGALLGPVSLKLATTSGGTMSPSQIAGVAGLTFLGLAFLGQHSKYYVTIPGTEIQLPQSIPDPLQYVPEQLEKKKKGEWPGFYAPMP